ncbi:signal peptidase II [Sulfitobacter sp. D35]|uniref:signal peptidase II n=1 Tax=Sulfitobacter sp. D35 TaxID=3083252 RepID=UPI00296EE26D|nr:signal peptidase II [Sulfitobacter sp. D35]MDW4498391.1 signal peptidase II [Sulfitobacter sp. D35]
MRLVFWSALVAILIDQVSKYVVVHAMELYRVREITVLPPVLNFRYGENRGINFGLLDGDSEVTRWVLIGLAVVICVAVLFWIRGQAMNRWSLIGAGLLVGGALANVIDRLLYGYVLDFLNMSCCGIDNPFVFNLADVFIFAGAAGLVLFAPDTGKTPRSKSPRRSGRQKGP